MNSAMEVFSTNAPGGKRRAMARRGALRLAILAIMLGTAGPGVAQLDSESRAVEIYAQRCMGCHGANGDGLGPAAERLNPPPRDFTLGLYKFKSSGRYGIQPRSRSIESLVSSARTRLAKQGSCKHSTG